MSNVATAGQDLHIYGQMYSELFLTIERLAKYLIPVFGISRMVYVPSVVETTGACLWLITHQ